MNVLNKEQEKKIKRRKDHARTEKHLTYKFCAICLFQM